MSRLMMGWLSQAEVLALGWTLLHFCWQGTAIAGVFALVSRMSLRARSTVRYVAALGALALMPGAVLATFALEMRTAALAATSVASPGAAQVEDAAAPLDALTARMPFATTSSAQQPGAWLQSGMAQCLPWIDGLWMMGVLLLGVRAMGGLWQLRQMRLHANLRIPAELEHRFRLMSERVKAGRRVALRISDEILSPLAMGVWRATVILPISALTRLPMDELEAVLAHELGHIRRLDCLCNLLQTCVESALFFHPAVWWVSQTVRDRREVCCDEIAVEHCASAVVYARALLRLEEQKTVPMRLALAAHGRGGSLLGRIKHVLGEGTTIESRATDGVRIALAGAVMTGLLLAPKVGKATATPAGSATPEPAAAQVAATATATQPQMEVTPPVQAHTVPALPKPETVALPEVEAGSAPVSAESAIAIPITVFVPHVKVKPFVMKPVEVRPMPAVTVRVHAMPSVERDGYPLMLAELQGADGKPTAKGSNYVDAMRDAGYPMDLNNDLDTLASMKSVGVTPEFAKSMSQIGLGKPTARDLIDLKAMGITPEYVESLKQGGVGPRDFHELRSEKAVGITADYAAAMKNVGFGDLDLRDLISLKAQNMTPEYAAWLKKQFPQATVSELRRAASFHLDDKFIAQAESHGFKPTDLDKLLKLKMSGLLDE